VAHPQHLRGEQHAAVPGGLGAHPRPAPGEALAGEHARLVAVGDPLVLPEQVADLPAADADVARGDVGVLAEVPVELGHEGLAEPHDLGVRAALGVEVAAALAAPDGHAGERVLEDLLEAEELHDAQVHRRVEPQAALVRAQGAVELDPEPAVDVHLAGVVGPRDAEDDLPLRLGDPLDQLGLDELRTLGQHRAERLQDLAHRLVELFLARVAPQDLLVEGLDLLIEDWRHACLRISSLSGCGGRPVTPATLTDRTLPPVDGRSLPPLLRIPGALPSSGCRAPSSVRRTSGRPTAPTRRAAPGAETRGMRADEVIGVEGLRKAYGGGPAVDGIDLHVARGEVFALLGPNGAGKSTTVEILEGFRSRDAGSVRVLGAD